MSSGVPEQRDFTGQSSRNQVCRLLISVHFTETSVPNSLRHRSDRFSGELAPTAHNVGAALWVLGGVKSCFEPISRPVALVLYRQRNGTFRPLSVNLPQSRACLSAGSIELPEALDCRYISSPRNTYKLTAGSRHHAAAWGHAAAKDGPSSLRRYPSDQHGGRRMDSLLMKPTIIIFCPWLSIDRLDNRRGRVEPPSRLHKPHGTFESVC